MPGRKSEFVGQRAPGARGRTSSAETAAAFLESYRKRTPAAVRTMTNQTNDRPTAGEG